MADAPRPWSFTTCILRIFLVTILGAHLLAPVHTGGGVWVSLVVIWLMGGAVGACDDVTRRREGAPPRTRAASIATIVLYTAAFGGYALTRPGFPRGLVLGSILTGALAVVLVTWEIASRVACRRWAA